MRRLLPLLLLLLAVPCARAAEEDIVTALLDWEPGTLGSVSAGRIPFKGDPPPDVEPLPGLVAPRYARIKMAGTKGLLLAYDANEENPRLWVDHDFDGELKDETQSAVTKLTSGWYRMQEVLARYAGETEAVPVTLRFMHSAAREIDYVTVYARIHRRGTVVLGGRLRFLALTDHSYDAAFGDERDRLYVDLNGDGIYQVAGDAPERVIPGTPFRVGDEGWVARVTSPSGRAVEFRRAKKVPPPVLRTWTTMNPPTAGTRRAPPAESFDELRKRFEAERSKSYSDRYATVNLLRNVGTKASFEFLLKIAGSDPDTSIQSAALRALGNPAYLEIGGSRVLTMAKKATSSRAYALAQALHDMGHPDREAVYLDMVGSSDSSAVNGAVRYLAYMRTKRGRALVLRTVREHGTPSIRHSAYVSGARYLEGGPPVPLMLAAAEDDYPSLKAEAIRDLGKLGHPSAHKRALVLAKERPVHVTVGQALAEVLGARGDAKAVAALLGFLEDPATHANVRKKVVEQLRFLRAPASIAEIVKGLRSKSPEVRGTAAEVLAGLPDPQITKELVKRAKKEKDDRVLPLMLEALGDHGHEMALALLLKKAKSRKKNEARRAAIRALARLGFHHPTVRTFLLALLASRGWEDRILALDAAGASGDPSLTAKITPNLSHERWQVRLAAVEALDRIRPAAAIEPLIAHLGREEEERVRDAVAAALFRLTGANLYDNAEIWQRWWAEHGKGFVVPKDIPSLPEQHAGGTQAGFYGIPVKSERVIFVIDQSGSMSASGGRDPDEKSDKPKNRLDVAVREVIGAVAKLKNRARVNVVLFHTTIHPWKPVLQRLSGGNRAALKRHLESKKPTGGTNLYDGLEIALRTKGVDTIFLLSDGMPGSGKYVSTPDILRAVRRENQTRRIAVHCVSIGMDSELLKRLARENGGRYARR